MFRNSTADTHETLIFMAAVALALVVSALITSGTPLFFPAWRRRSWEKVARAFDLYCDEESYWLEGRRYGVDIFVKLEELTEGSRIRRVTQYSVPLGGNGIPPMRLQPENKLLGINLDRLLKRTEVEVGFGKLDSAFLINGEDKEAIAEFFKRAGVSAALLRCFKNVRGKLTYNKGALRVTHSGVATKKQLRANIEALCRCGAAMAEAGQAHLAERARQADAAGSSKFGA